MKTKNLVIIMVLCSASVTKAQGLYFGLGAGYGFAAAKQSFIDDRKTTYVGPGSVDNEYTAHPFSNGKGMNFGLLVGYMMNQNMGIELGVSYLAGSKNVFTDEGTTGPSSSHSDEYIIMGNMIRLVPTLRMKFGDGKLTPYMKAGLIVGIAGKITTENNTSSTDPSGTDVSVDIWEYSGGMSLGFHGGIGINYALSDKLSLFGEVAANYQSYAPSKASLTEATYNGADQLAGMTTSQKEKEFVDSYTYNNSAPSSPGSATQDTKVFWPFSSIGINIGLIISMGGSDK